MAVGDKREIDMRIKICLDLLEGGPLLCDQIGRDGAGNKINDAFRLLMEARELLARRA